MLLSSALSLSLSIYIYIIAWPELGKGSYERLSSWTILEFTPPPRWPCRFFAHRPAHRIFPKWLSFYKNVEFSREQLGRVVNKTRTSEIVRKKQCIQRDEKLLQRPNARRKRRRRRRRRKCSGVHWNSSGTVIIRSQDMCWDNYCSRFTGVMKRL
jgi:hypothetical protein